MPGKEFLDALVKLASLGASGISIFAIFWIGWLMLQSRAEPDPERHKTLRFFMIVCVIISMISAATGLANAKFNADVIRKLEIKNIEQAEKIDRYEAERIKNREVAESLSQVLQQKEVAALDYNAPPEIKRHITILKNSISRLRGSTN